MNGLVPEHMQNLLVGKGFVKLVTDKNQRLEEKMERTVREEDEAC